MPAYSNRPGYGEPLPMSGDYQAIPRAPRTPHFPEPSVRGQYGHGYAQTGPFPAQSARSIPSPPGSLAPMAMASARSAVATGPQQTMDAGPSRPSAKAGMSILLAGAIIGGLIGAVMHARQNAADAIAAASMHEPAPITAPASASSAPPIAPLASASGGVITNFPNDKVADKKDADKKDSDKKDADKKDADKADKKGKTGGAKKFAFAGGGKKAAGPAETVAAAEEPETTTASAGEKKKKKGAKDDDDGYTIASADGSSGSSASSGSSSKADKADKGGDKSDKKESSSKKGGDKGGDKETKAASSEKKSGGSKGGDDAVNVLKAAMGATENTL